MKRVLVRDSKYCSVIEIPYVFECYCIIYCSCGLSICLMRCFQRVVVRRWCWVVNFIITLHILTNCVNVLLKCLLELYNYKFELYFTLTLWNYFYLFRQESFHLDLQTSNWLRASELSRLNFLKVSFQLIFSKDKVNFNL